MSGSNPNLDHLADEFEAQWQGLARPNLVEFLERVEKTFHDALARMLIAIDAEYRMKHGEQVQAEDYAALGAELQPAVEFCLGGLFENPDHASQASDPGETQEPRQVPANPVHGARRRSTAASMFSKSQQIGPYKLLQKLGEGGMGMVWMADQEKPVRRRVALKLIKSGLDNKQVIARFEAERQALAMMDHQNIAKVLDAGTTADGSPYFVMELVHGIPFNKYCDQNKLSINERLELFIPVCKAIQHAHQKGIIHRDLKPTNVLVSLYDGKPVPKVIDFGLAKALQHTQKLTDRTMFTEFGQVVGTLQYMSPEQAEMNQLDIDTRTDIYSLGVILYELLTGSTPIDAETLKQQAILKVLESIREKDPPRPSLRLSSITHEAASGISGQRRIEVSKLKTILRGELDWIVMRALEKDRTRRYETANGFAKDVENYLTGDIVAARPPSASYRIRKYVRRHKGLVASITAFITLLFGSAVLSSSLALWANKERVAANSARDLADQKKTEAELARDKADVNFKRAVAEKEKASASYLVARKETEKANRAEKSADAALAFMSNELLISNPSARSTSQKLLLDAIKAADDNHVLRDEPRVESRLRLALGGMAGSLGNWQIRTEQLEKALVLCSKHSGPNHPNTIDVLSKLVNAYRFQRDNESAKAVADAAILKSTNLFGQQHDQTISVQVELALALVESNDLPRARTLLDEPLKSAVFSKPNDHWAREYFHTAFGQLLLAEGDLVGAKSEAEKALKASILRTGGESSYSFVRRLELARIATQLEASADHEAQFRSTAYLGLRTLGPSHSQVAYCIDEYTGFLAKNNRHNEAEIFLLEIAANRQFGNDPITAFRERFMAFYRTCPESYLISESEPEVAIAAKGANLTTFLKSCRSAANAESANKSMEPKRGTTESEIDKSWQCVVVTRRLMKLSRLFRDGGMTEDEITVLKQLLKLRNKQLGEEHPLSRHATYRLAIAVRKNGDESEAKRLFEAVGSPGPEFCRITVQGIDIVNADQVYFELTENGFHVVDLTVNTDTATPKYDYIFEANEAVLNHFVKPILTPSDFASIDQDAAFKGFELVTKKEYVLQGTPTIAALWLKQRDEEKTLWRDYQSVPKSGNANAEFELLDERLASILARNNIPGATFAVARKGKLVHELGFGVADSESRRPMKADTLMRAPPASELVTAFTVAMLVADGRINLQDPIEKYLVPPSEISDSNPRDQRWSQVTVRHLLNHCSGLTLNVLAQQWKLVKTIEPEFPLKSTNCANWILRQKLEYDPGQQATYSSANYVLLGKVIESASGLDYEKYVRQSLLEPFELGSFRLGKTDLRELGLDEARYYGSFTNTGPSFLKIGERHPLAYGGTFSLEQYPASMGWICTASDLARLISLAGDSHVGKQEVPGTFRELYNTPTIFLPFSGGRYFLGGLTVNDADDSNRKLSSIGGIEGSMSFAVLLPDGTAYAVICNSNRIGDGITPIAELDEAISRFELVGNAKAEFDKRPIECEIDCLNDLRDWFSRVDEKRSLAFADEILKRRPMDEYMLKVIGGFEDRTSLEDRIRNFESAADNYPGFRHLSAACNLKVAELCDDFEKKKAVLQEIRDDPATDVGHYKTLAKDLLDKFGLNW